MTTEPETRTITIDDSRIGYDEYLNPSFVVEGAIFTETVTRIPSKYGFLFQATNGNFYFQTNEGETAQYAEPHLLQYITP